MRGSSNSDGTYNIDYNGQEFAFEDPITKAKPGETVLASFVLIATDTDYDFEVRGVDRFEYVSNPKSQGITISFVMPSNDVSVIVTSRNTMNPEKN